MSEAAVETKIFEEEGKTFIEIEAPVQTEEVVEGAGGESDKEQTPKDKLESKKTETEEVVVDTEGEEKVPEFYKDKTPLEMAKLLTAANKKISQDGEEKKLLKNQIDESQLTPAELRKRFTSPQMKTALDEERKALREIDRDTDPDGYDAQADLVDDLKTEYLDRKQAERTEGLHNSGLNDSFISTHQDTLKTQGFDLNEADYGDVIENAKAYADHGLLTADAVHKALIDTYGLEAVTKTISTKAGEKARTDIITAEGKTQPISDVGGTGKTGGRISVDDFVAADGEKQAKILKGLSKADKKKLREKISAL